MGGSNMEKDTRATNIPPYLYWIAAIIVFTLFQLSPLRQIFFNHIGRWLYIFLYAFALSFVITPIARQVALKFGILDHPEGHRKIHKGATPLLGGLSVYISFTAALVSNMIVDFTMMVIIATGFVLAIVCLIDDWLGLSARIKLICQFVLTVILLISGIVLDFFPIHTWWGQSLNYLMTIVWIIGITNAMNFLDGMDGLAAGLGVMISLYLGIIAFQSYQPTLGWIAVAMMGSCLGFLPYNFRRRGPALIFLGDLGSIFIGYILATLAIVGDWSERDPIVSFTAPVLIFWVLIYDMTFITVERIKSGKVRTLREWIEYVGRDHIHHRMYTLIGDQYRTVLLVLLLSGTLGITAITLRNARTIDSILLIVQAILITLIVSILNHFGNHKKGD